MSESYWPHDHFGEDPPPIPEGCIRSPDDPFLFIQVEPVKCEWCGCWTRWTHNSRFGKHRLCHDRGCMDLFMEAMAAVEAKEV